MTTERVILYACMVVAIILHEVSHGVMALVYGDDTAKRAGRLTLNPVPHVDLFGSIILPAMAVLASLPVLGWAKPVPVNPMKLRDPRRQMLFVGLVGPFTNLALMFTAAVAVRSMGGAFGPDPPVDLRYVLFIFAVVNLYLGVFNMLPIPPLDGASLIERVLPRSSLLTWHKVRPYGFLILFLLLFYFDVFSQIIEPFFDALKEFVEG